MSLVTRFSIFFLVALALALGGFCGSLYYVAGLHLRLRLDQDLRTTLDDLVRGTPPRNGQIAWALYDERGQRTENSPGIDGMMIPEHRDLKRLLVDVPMTMSGADGMRWRILARPLGGSRRREGPAGPHRFSSGLRRRADDPGKGAGRDRRPDGSTAGREERPGPSSPARRHRPSVVMVGASLEPVEAELRELAAALPLISSGLWLLAAVVGRYFGRRAFSPLTRMAATARAMPWDDDSRRLPSPGTQDELEEFAGSFNGLLDRLHEALARQRHLTGQASHQLCTPLAAFITTIDVARRRQRTIEEHERILDRLHHDSQRLWRIVESLLFLARSEAEARPPDLERLDLAAWSVDHLRGWNRHERAADLLCAEVTDSPAWVLAHQPLLGQLLDNLIENACKYSDIGSPIRLSIRREPHTIVLGVEDEGRGVSAEDLPRLFEPFFRAEQARRDGRAGVGLGLAVVQRIASALGGAMHVDSELGRGSHFQFRLPDAEGPSTVYVERRRHESVEIDT
jgi:signal transduction histidine kinase